MVRGLLVFLSLVATASAQNNYGLGNLAGALGGGQQVFLSPAGFTPQVNLGFQPDEEVVRQGICIASEGFFYLNRQCFKFVTAGSAVTWPQAKQTCHHQKSDGRPHVLAHPRDPTHLRNYIVKNYAHPNPGEQVEAWLNAKYDETNQAYKWQDDFTFIPNGSPLWWLSPNPLKGGCLLLLAWKKREDVAKYKPYFGQYCDTRYRHVLCEKILD